MMKMLYDTWFELVCIAVMWGVLSFVLAHCALAETLACRNAPGEPRSEWHYRTKIPGGEGQCWYHGPRMKPRAELEWTDHDTRAPAREWEQGHRWVDPRGWTHQE
jgi:hypothetical protein